MSSRKKTLLIIAVIGLLLVVGYMALNAITNSSRHERFTKEYSAIELPTPLSENYGRDCAVRGALGPSVRVCSVRYEKLYPTTGSLCSDYTQISKAMKQAGYLLSREAYQGIGKTENNEYIEDQQYECKMLEARADSEFNKDGGFQMILFAKGSREVRSGSFYMQCMIGTAKHPYNWGEKVDLPAPAASIDKTKIYGCILQGNV